MDYHISILFAITAIGLALFLKPWLEEMMLPYAAGLMLIGFVGSELLIGLGYDTGIRFDNFQTIISTFLLPVLVFNMGLSLDSKYLLRDAFSIVALAIPVLLLTLLFTAIGIYSGIQHPSGFPWLAAFITASLLCATSPDAINDLMKKIRAPKRIVMMLDGEGLFADIIAIVLFSLFIEMAMQKSLHHSFLYWLGYFSYRIFIGVLVGVAVGWLCYYILRAIKDPLMSAFISLLATFFVYLLARDALQGSGVLAVFSLSLILRQLYKLKSNHFIRQFWAMTALIATTGVFLLVGVTVTIPMFEERWLAMIIGIIAVLLARLISVYGCLSLFSWTHLIKPIRIKQQSFIALAGMRGAITIALAFSIPMDLSYWWTIQAIAFGVVIFTLLIQAPIALSLMRERTKAN